MNLKHRHGISLIETIACLALTAILIVPISGMIASANRIEQRSAAARIESDSRDTLRWIRRELANSPVIETLTTNRLQYRDAANASTSIERVGSVLIHRQSNVDTTILENVRRLRFDREPTDLASPIVGINIQLEVLNPATNEILSSNLQVAR